MMNTRMAHEFTNQEVAEHLRAVAAAYIVKNADRFRIMAYERAAASVEHATSEVKDLWDDKKLDQLAGVGPNIASHLDELFRTGRVKHFDQVMSGLPKAMFKLLYLPGVGAKTAYKLCQALKISNPKIGINDLEKAAKAGKIRIIEGFGERSEKDILEAIKAFKTGQIKERRMLLPYADSLAHDVLSYLEQCPAVSRVDALGSLRRLVSTIGDVDIAAQTREPARVIEWFIKYPKIKRVLSKGEEALVRVVLKNGRQIDLRLQTPNSYGAMLQYFTGSKSHNISLREWALKRGMSLSEHGIKKIKNQKSKVKSYQTEEEFYEALGLFWIPPELREDKGEIQASLRSARGETGGLPKLVELKDLKGDLHIHSDFPIETSHDEGVNTMEEILEKGESLGYEYLGFSEHNPSSAKHSPKQVTELLKRKREKIDQLNYSSEKRGNKLPIRSLNGLEIDIKPSGELGITEEGLELLDYAIASVHTSFEIPPEKMTKRVLRALDHPKVKIFGHPTGRKLNEREGYELNWERIFEFCLKKDKWLEINAWPDRLDLPDSLVSEAVRRGVRLIINSDSHQVDQMSLMEYGISVARRGWAEKSDIMNSITLEEFLQELKLR